MPKTAGIILSGSYVAAALVSEFGLLPPSFLPLANKRLYCWQIENMLPHVESVTLAVPDNYALDAFDEDWLTHNHVAVKLVDPAKSLGHSVASVLSGMADDVTEIVMLFGDTLVDGAAALPPESVAVGFVHEYSRWGYCRATANGGLEFFENTDAGHDPSQPVVIGYFRLDRQALQNALKQSGNNFYAAMNIYGAALRLAQSDRSTDWHDFGHINAYFRSRQNFSTERSFNKVRIEKRRVIKQGNDQAKILAEAAWYENIPRALEVYAPAYLGRIGQGYATEYMFLPSVNDLFVYGHLPEYVWGQILGACGEFLVVCRMHAGMAECVPESFSLQTEKTQSRLDQFATSRGIDMSRGWIFNGIHIPSLHDIYLRCLALIPLPQASDISIIHGDFHFANMFFDFRSLGIKLVDPRGLLRQQPTIYGDHRYDIAKLTHSVDGLYDVIMAGILRAEMHHDYAIDLPHYSNRHIDRVRDVFGAMTFNGLSPRSVEIRAMVVLLFLSMLPLHADDVGRQNTLLANAFRLFLELEA